MSKLAKRAVQAVLLLRAEATPLVSFPDETTRPGSVITYICTPGLASWNHHMRLAAGMIPHMAERTRLHRAYVRALCTQHMLLGQLTSINFCIARWCPFPSFISV